MFNHHGPGGAIVVGKSPFGFSKTIFDWVDVRWISSPGNGENSIILSKFLAGSARLAWSLIRLGGELSSLTIKKHLWTKLTNFRPEKWQLVHPYQQVRELVTHHCWNDIVVQNLNVLSRIHHLLPRQNDQIMRLTAKRSPHCNTYKISNKISIKILMIYQLKWKDWLLIDNWITDISLPSEILTLLSQNWTLKRFSHHFLARENTDYCGRIFTYAVSRRLFIISAIPSASLNE